MVRSFNASTTFHPFSPSPVSSSIIGVFKAANIAQPNWPSTMSSSTAQTISVTSQRTQTPGTPSQLSNTITTSTSSQSPSSAAVLTSPTSSPFTVNGIVVATSIAPFSAIGAPGATPVDLSTPTPSATDSSTAAASTPLSRPGLISISVVGGVIAVLFVSLLFFALRRRRRLLDQRLQLDSAPCSPPSRHYSYSRSPSQAGIHITAKTSSSFSQSRASPSPLPIFTNTPYHDEKEVYTPGPASSIYLNTKRNDELQLALPSPSFSPRKPTHPLLATPPPPSPLAPITTALRSTPGPARRSWNFDVTPPKRSLDLPVPIQLTTVNSYPNIRSQSQNQPVSPMYPMSPLTPGGNISGFPRAGPMTPISPLVSRNELPSPSRISPGPVATTFSDVQWNAGSTHRSQRASRLNEEVDVVLSMPAPEQAPVELPADRGSRWGPETPASFVGMAPAPTRATMQSRSDKGKSVASSRYSQASGWTGAEGDRVIPEMPAQGLERTTTWNSNGSTVKSRRSSWSEGNFSIQSILDLMRSASQKGHGGRV